MNFKAILFDMDGVVIDSESAVVAFWEQVARRHHIALTQDDFDSRIFGCPCRQTLDTVFPHLTAEAREIVLAEEKVFETDMTYTAMPGVVQLLGALRQYDIPAALVTSGERWKVAEVMGQLGIGDLFAAYVTAEDVAQGKPHPACYRLGGERLNTTPEQCIAFEDSISGMQAAVAAGAFGIGIRPERTAPALLAEGARCVIPNFKDVRLQYDENNILNIGGIPNSALRFG